MCFPGGKEIHYGVLCAVFWVFWGRRACGFVRVFGGVILIQKEYRFSVGLKVLLEWIFCGNPVRK